MPTTPASNSANPPYRAFEAFRQPSVVETDLARYDDGDYTQEGNPNPRPEAIATLEAQIALAAPHSSG